MEKENYNGYHNENGEPNLYDDLPKEIVDMLMETHPLIKNEQLDGDTLYRRRNVQNNAQMEQNEVSQNTMSQNTSAFVDWSGNNNAPSEETLIGRRTRRYAQEDGDQQYTARFQTIQSENDIPQNAYQPHTGYENQENIYQTQKIDFTPQYSQPQQNYDDFNYDNQYQQQPEYMEESNTYQNSYQGGYQQEEYTNNSANAYDMPERRERKGPLMQEIEITLPGAGGREEGMEGRRNRRSYEDYDLTRGAKQMDLDELYSDDYDDEESISFRPGRKFGMIFSIIAIVVVGFLAFRCISLGGKLKEAEKTIAEHEDLSERYEALEMDKLKLEDELKALKSGGTASAEGEGTEQNNSENANNSETNSEDPGNFDWYTVTDSDGTWWGLAQKFYGDGTQYTKILEANGKKESDYVRTGDKLKIPK